MNIPNDPVMLLSYINTQLRDFYPTLNELCSALNLSKDELCSKLSAIDYEYDEEANQFVCGGRKGIYRVAACRYLENVLSLSASKITTFIPTVLIHITKGVSHVTLRRPFAKTISAPRL